MLFISTSSFLINKHRNDYMLKYSIPTLNYLNMKNFSIPHHT